MVIDFNKIYVIQSLDVASGDELTGEQLYNEVLQFFNAKYSDKNAELINVDTPNELYAALEKIKHECLKDGIKPIIHFEIHGLEDKTGLSLNKGDVNWLQLYGYLIEINIASKWNLFITMGVCFGNYAMFLIKPSYPAPFSGVLGSFEELYEDDLYIRYNAFYQELLNSLDFEKALEALHNSNPSLPDDYRFISAEQTFKNVYQKYFDNEFSTDKIKERYKKALKDEGISFTNRDVRHKFYVQFHVQLKRTKEKFFIRDKEIFFMFDKFPGHVHIYCTDWEPDFRK